MTEAERLNQILTRDAPGIARCLSPLGLNAAFPKGIPYQSAAAKDTEINATIGQLTNGMGSAMPLSILESLVPELDTKMTFLYTSVDGHKDVRQAWADRERRLGGSAVPVALPMATHGLTHGLSVIASLFADPDTTVIIPAPFWGNYRLIFQLHTHAKIKTFDFYDGDGFNLKGLADTLDQVQGKSIVLLNLPGNPTGYALMPEEAEQLCAIVAQHKKPTVFVVDDAYQGFIFEPSRHQRSEFWDLAEAIDPEHHVLLKVDGATKELLFFGSRLGFVTHPHVTGEAEEAFASKFTCVIRGTVGSPPGPSQALVLHALRHPGLEAAFQERFAVMQGRYEALKQALKDHPSDRLVPYPFNAAFFMLFKVDGISSEVARQRLIAEESVGTIAFSDPNSLRVAFCSVQASDIPRMMEKIVRVIG